MSSVCDWTALPTEMLECIANRLPLTEDFNAFRGVCTSWRAVDVKCAPVSKVPLLMLAERDGSDEREFYSLAKGRICMRKAFPDATGKRCINVGFGWILTCAPSGDVCLLKPFSHERSEIQLPNVRTYPLFLCRFMLHQFIFGALLTADPSETSDFKVVVAISLPYIGFWRNSSDKWTWVDTKPIGVGMAYDKDLGEMYTLDIYGQVSIWDPQTTDLTIPQRQAKVDNAPNSTPSPCSHYLVKSTDGELLMITRNNAHEEGYVATGADHFKVMRVDLVKGELIEINGLGNDAVFVGDCVAVSVDATEFPGVLKPNCIYFMDDCIIAYANYMRWECPQGGGKDMGIYNVANRSIERFSVESFSHISPPLWVFPQF